MANQPIDAAAERFRICLAEMQAALTDEIAAAQRSFSRSIDLWDGRRLYSAHDGLVYSFSTDVELPMASETPVKLLVPDRDPVNGVLVEAEDFSVLLDLKEDIGEAVPNGALSAEPWFILDRARDRLAELTDQPQAEWGQAHQVMGLEQPRPISPGIASSSKKPVPPPNRNPSQQTAMSHACEFSLHYVWGPPGTGKTQTLGSLVRCLLDLGERTLVLAHANVAVDVAMCSIAKECSGTQAFQEGEVLRWGIIRLPEVRAILEIQPEAILERQQRDLIANKRRLVAERRRLSSALQLATDGQARTSIRHELTGVRADLQAIEKLIAEATSALLAGAKVLGTTLSWLVINDLIWKWRPTTVIVDEASMASFPFVLAAGSRALRRMTVFGDFRQLPPIYLADSENAKRWFGRDAFEQAGVVERVDRGEPEPRLSLLDIQYRMAPPIAKIVGDLSYDSRLHTDSTVPPRVAPMSAWPPEEGQALVLWDTEELKSSCFHEEKLGSFSRVNLLHGALVRLLVQAALAAGADEVGVITPYRAQARLYRALFRGSPMERLVTAATVHRFQGSERSAVFVDLVDGFNQSGASQLTGANPDTARRLLNVALSRSKGKLVVVADCGFLRVRHPAQSPARTLLRFVPLLGSVVRMEANQMPGLDASISEGAWPDWESVQRDLAREVRIAESRVLLNLPDGFAPSSGLVGAITVAARRVSQCRVYLPVSLAGQLEDAKAELQLRVLPAGFLGVIDKETSYIGGLSPTSPVIRVRSRYVTEVILALSLGERQRKH